MLKDIKRLVGEEHYQALKKPAGILLLDAIFHGFIYSMLFFVLMDLVSGTLAKKKLIMYAIIMIIASVLRYITLRDGYTKMQISGANAIAYLRIRLGDYIRDLNMGYFNKHNIGEITNIITNDLRDFEQLITHQLPSFLKLIILILYLSGILIGFERRLGLLQVGIMALSLPLTWYCAKAIKKAGFQAKKVRATMLSRVIEYVSGISVFKSYNMVGRSFKNLENSMKEVRKESIRTELSAVPYMLPFLLVVNITFPIMLFLCVQGYFQHRMSPQAVVTFLVISLALTKVMAGMGAMFAEMRYFSLALEKLISILDRNQISYQDKVWSPANFDVGFEDVSFEYLKGKEVLQHVSFQAKAGQTTALVGHSGSGKSTVLNLIGRFWDIKEGKISIGGKNIAEVYPDTLLESISMVFQDVYLLEDTVFENIRMGRKDITMEQVVQAANIAHCHEFIQKMPQGYQSLISEGGNSLSGGEKQRISIARALIKNAPIVLLDEATASLDVDNEYEIHEALRVLLQDKTVLVIAHRLNTIKDAEQILVFDSGKIMEKGSHAELMKEKGSYYRMYDTMCKAKEWQI